MAQNGREAGGSVPAIPKVSVIIVNYNSGARLVRVLSCLAAQTFRDFEVILIDNASNDGSADAPAPSDLVLNIIRSRTNIGFAGANNEAAREAKGEWLALLNPDAYPEPDWLAALMDATSRYPDVSAFGSTQINAADPARLDGAGDAYLAFGLPWRGAFGWPVSALPGEGEIFSPCAASALWRVETFRRLGGFDESFFCYGEDVDLGFRLRLAGGRVVQIPSARVLHEGSGIAGRRSTFAVYHGHRNRVWTYFKDMPALLLWPTLPVHLALNVLLFARCAAYGRGGAYLNAMIDAAKGMLRIVEARRDIQRERRARLSEIAKAFSWSPLKAARREAAIRPLAGDGEGSHV